MDLEKNKSSLVRRQPQKLKTVVIGVPTLKNLTSPTIHRDFSTFHQRRFTYTSRRKRTDGSFKEQDKITLEAIFKRKPLHFNTQIYSCIKPDLVPIKQSPQLTKHALRSPEVQTDRRFFFSSSQKLLTSQNQNFSAWETADTDDI
ncbi:hypothetical protein pb186bvf_016860 [Paramecium bursaria]